MVSVGTSIVPPGPCPPPADTPGLSTVITTPQVTASIHDFAASLQCGPHRKSLEIRARLALDKDDNTELTIASAAGDIQESL
jgi:hypothetical protein